MAKNQVAKISVGIEAKVDGLAADMKKAESTVKSGAKNIEKTVESAATRMERSWTEAFSKIGVIMQLAQTVEQAFNAVSGVIKVLGDDSLNSSQKIVGSMEAIESANIPVLSSFLRIGHSISDMITGEKNLRNAVLRRQAAQVIIAKDFASQQQELADLTKDRQKDIALQEHLNEKTKALTNEEKVLLQVEWERKKLAEELAATVDASTLSNRNAMKDLIALNEELEIAAEEAFAKRVDAAKEADAKIIAGAEKTAAAEKAIVDRKVADDKKANDLRLSNVKDIESKILQMELEAAGKSDEARQEAIRRSYEKQIKISSEAFAKRVAAEKEADAEFVAGTDNRTKLLQELMGLEMAAAGADPTVADSGGGGGAASIATAIGSFTVGASPELKELKKQTELQAETLAALNKDGGQGITLPT